MEGAPVTTNGGGGKGSSSRFRRVCVFCGSSSGKRSSYRDAAVELGKELVARKVDLVYGGGSLGLMGEVSEAVHKGGGHVIGVIPTTLMGKEITGETVGEVRAVAGMHQRKAEMARNSDAFIALPGGYGTLDELLEVIAWAQLGIHSKPVGLLNVDGYYNLLLAFIDKAVDDGFIKPSQRHIFVSAPDARDLVQRHRTGEHAQPGEIRFSSGAGGGAASRYCFTPSLLLLYAGGAVAATTAQAPSSHRACHG